MNRVYGLPPARRDPKVPQERRKLYKPKVTEFFSLEIAWITGR